MAGALERVAQDRELALTADELGARVVGDVDTEARSRCERLPDGDRLGFALRLDGSCLAVVDCLAGGAVGRLVGEDAVDGCG